MPNALEPSVPPPQPMAQPQAQSPMPGGPGAASGGPPQQPPRPAPAPTHEQTVAILRHMDAMIAELEKLTKNPNIGRSSIKSDVIDATTRLVADRFLTPAEAVQQLSTFPNEPLEQRKWVRQHLVNAVLAENRVLDNHRQAFPGTGDLQFELARSRSNPDTHAETISAAMGHYRG